MPIELDTNYSDGAKIKVVGVGGGGGNAINNMIDGGLEGVEFIATNTDKQALTYNLAPHKIQIGTEMTRGLGAGGDPTVGSASVEENLDDIREALKGSDMVFITAGMGGGTGTGAAPMVAKLAKEINSLVVGIVTKPFIWEGKKRMANALGGIIELRQHVDALIVIPNQKVLDIIEKDCSFKEAYKIVDEVLFNATRGISDIIGYHGMVNVDFADVVAIMKDMGDALMGIGTASGENRAEKATRNALESPLLEGISIKGAQGVLVNITGGENLTMHEISQAVAIVEEETGGNANLIHGVVENHEMKDEISITVVATGFENGNYESPKEPEKKKEPVTLFSNNDFESTRTTEKDSWKPSRDVTGPRVYTRKIDKNDNHVENATPRGTDALTEFDVPAFIRRGINLPPQLASLAIDNIDQK